MSFLLELVLTFGFRQLALETHLTLPLRNDDVTPIGGGDRSSSSAAAVSPRYDRQLTGIWFRLHLDTVLF
jgi:hypothetical protein